VVRSFLVVVGVVDEVDESGGYDGKDMLSPMETQHTDNG